MSKNNWMIILTMFTCLLLTSCQSEKTYKGVEFPESLLIPEEANYKTAEVKASEYIKTNSGKLSLVYPMQAKITCSVSNAKLEKVFVTEGKEVKKGEILATLKIEEDSVRRKELELQLKRAMEEYDLEIAKKEAAIEAAVINAQELSFSQLRIAELNIEKQRIALEKYIYLTEKQIEKIRDNIEEMDEIQKNGELVAPMDGVVKTITSRRIGDWLNKGEVIVSMYSTDYYLLKAADIGEKLRYNMNVTVETGSSGSRRTYPAKVISSPNILPSTVLQTYALIQLDDSVEPINFVKKATFSGNVQELYEIPAIDKNAIRRDNSKYYVYILEDGMVKTRYIKVGPSDGNVTWILDGVDLGQKVILD